MKYLVLVCILISFSCGDSKVMYNEDFEKGFKDYKGTKNGNPIIGGFLASAPTNEIKSVHTDLLNIIIHLKPPVMELEKGDSGLPDEETKKSNYSNFSNSFFKFNFRKS